MCKCSSRRRRRKFAMVQDPGNAGAWTIVEILRRPVMVVSDDYTARKLMRAMAKEARS